MTTRSQKAPPGVPEIKTRIARAAVKGAPKAVVEQARRALLAWVGTAERHGLDARDILRRLASGEAAAGVGLAIHGTISDRPPEVVRNAACRSGCAYCCILSGGDGGTITETEARRISRDLADLAGKPDGRAWHPAACAALDPDTQTCRIYEARPVVCRSFISTDAEACRENAEGGEAAGAGLLGSHPTYLAALALTRTALGGTLRVKTYALDRLAAACIGGATGDDALAAALQKPRALDDALKGTGRAIAAAQRR